ncbi:MAG: hypothetical protein COA79_24125 [Planctomycetota bacterium]|nr:MAG: hypothetical protein COA79_24125 [Planctomycetota bacterium]
MKEIKQFLDKKMNEELAKVPIHVAIIMDGNGRWAKQKGFLRMIGHENGGNRVKELVETSQQVGVKFMTLYTFSTENWSRPKKEVKFLMNLLIRFLKQEIPDLVKNNVQLKTIGRIEELPQNVQDKIKWAKSETSKNDGLVLTLALNYGSRTEIVDAVNQINEDIKNNKINSPITEEIFENYLYASNTPDPDLLIRTAGEMRISNFLLWQISYAEIYVTDVYFPDFSKDEYLKALEEFQNRKRRFGGLLNK